MDPGAPEPDQGDLDNPPAAEPPLLRDSSRTPSALLFFKRLIHIWPDIDINVVPQFLKALAGLLASNHVVGLLIKYLCLKPGLLWFVGIFLLGNLKWCTPNTNNNGCIHGDRYFRRNNVLIDLDRLNTTVWCLIPFLYILKFLVESDVRYSSVWCSELQHQLRTCRFSNLYYDTHHGFLFLLDESSVISGIQNFEEFKNLKLSPIADHKGVNMDIMMVRSSDVSPFSFKFSNSFWFYEFIKFIEEPHFVLKRFKPDNLMHVVHDDLIPLFIKFRELSTGNVSHMASTTNLFFADMNDYGPFSEWYQALSSTPPLLSKDMSSSTMYCFSSLYMGTSNTSFYQYGFNKSQGPIRPNLSGRDIGEFKQYYLDYFGVKPNRAENKLKVMVISRKINRKIVNVEKISSTLSTLVNEDSFFKGKTIAVAEGDMIANKMEILNLVASSDIVVGMHGAETILSLFLPESSVFIEMFPFGISRDNVSPVYSLSKAKGVHFRYLSWANLNEQNSMVHPEYPKEFGGIEQLPEELKQKIYDTKQVPAVPCCNNPFYLFRMYQDTIIDDSFSKVASTAFKLLKSKNPIATAQAQWFFPGPVLNLDCHRYPNHANVSWTAPHNMEHIQTKYNVSVLADLVHRNVFTDESMIRFDFGKDFQTVQVWVSSEVDGRKSIDSYCKCKFVKNNLDYLLL